LLINPFVAIVLAAEEAVFPPIFKKQSASASLTHAMFFVLPDWSIVIVTYGDGNFCMPWREETLLCRMSDAWLMIPANCCYQEENGEYCYGNIYGEPARATYRVVIEIKAHDQPLRMI
jgi:hypothetical protein